jgi:hypothetical protein
MDRKYTVAEIDELRQVVENKYLWGSYSGPVGGNGDSRAYLEQDKTAAVEQMVRTHMLAGHTAIDLRASERPPKSVN